MKFEKIKFVTLVKWVSKQKSPSNPKIISRTLDPQNYWIWTDSLLKTCSLGVRDMALSLLMIFLDILGYLFLPLQMKCKKCSQSFVEKFKMKRIYDHQN